LTQFQPESVHEEIVARAKEMLCERDRHRTQRDLDLEKVETIGAGTGLAFYVWVCMWRTFWLSYRELKVNYVQAIVLNVCSLMYDSRDISHIYI